MGIRLLAALPELYWRYQRLLLVLGGLLSRIRLRLLEYVPEASLGKECLIERAAGLSLQSRSDRPV